MSNERVDVAPVATGNRRAMPLVLAGLGLLGLMAVALVVGLILLFINSTSAQRAALPKPKVDVNQPAPDFQLRTLQGETVKLSELRGQPVWLNFWAAWCAPCRQEIPDLIAEGKKAGDQGVRLLTIDTGEGEQEVRRYLKTSGYSELPTALDQDGSVASAYGVLGLPTHVFIDSQGTVRRVNLGPMSADAMRRAVSELR